MSDEIPQSEELSQVVLRKDPEGRNGLLALRPLAVTALVLLLAEVLLRFLPADERVLRDPLHPYGCYQDDAQAALLQARAQPGDAQHGLDVVLLGDSVLSSVSNRAGERIEDYLLPRLRAARAERGLPTMDLRVYNLGEGGSHAADLYAAYGRLTRLLAAAPSRRPVLFVLNSNIIFFSRRQAHPAMLYPCLADALGPEDAFLPKLLHLPPPMRALEARLTTLVTRHCAIYQQRRHVNEVLFGGPPRQRLVVVLTNLRSPRGAATGDPNLPWTARGLTAAQYAPNYDLIPFSSPEAVNLAFTKRLAERLARPLPFPSRVFVFFTPQNHGLLGALADNPGYHDASAAIAAVFQQAGVPFRSYDGEERVPNGLFIDLDHLTARGNQRLAELLADDLVTLTP